MTKLAPSTEPRKTTTPADENFERNVSRLGKLAPKPPTREEELERLLFENRAQLAKEQAEICRLSAELRDALAALAALAAGGAA